MKRFRYFASSVVLSTALVFFSACSPQEVMTGDYALVSPQIRELAIGDAEAFVLKPGTVISIPADGSLAVPAAILAGYLKTATGADFRITDRCPRKGFIRLEVDPALGRDLADFRQEACYRIVSDSRGITLTGGSVAGILHGIQTLYAALPVAEAAGDEPAPGAVRLALPAAELFDYPEFPYRSFMLDCGRHFFAADYIKQLIDILALHKLNYFHWHLTEDQGWRLEIKKYPRLTEIGTTRPGTVDPRTGELDGVPVSGFYTQNEAREIVRYAAERGITVIPEIDMPGHTQAALAAYPELGCTGGPYEVATRYGVLDDVLCVGKDATMTFVKDVLSEVLDIFPSEYIHLGGDECPKDRWAHCPDCQRKIRELGLKSSGSKTKEELLQSWFTSQVEAFLAERGRRMICWNDVLCDWGNQVIGEPSRRTVIAGWMRPVSAEIAVREGYDAILCPVGHLYFSNAEANRLTGAESIRRVYDLPVIPDGLTPEQRQHILGVEACIWSERVADTDSLEWRLLPRLSTLSELQWAAPATHQGDTPSLSAYLPRLRHMTTLYTSRGWHWKTDIAEAWEVPKE